MESDLVTIRRYHFLGEAHVVRGFLESAGIPCFVANQITSAHHATLGIGRGGVCLQVRRGDVDAAEELLEETGWEELSLEAPPAGLPDAQSRAEDSEETCPSCSLGAVAVKPSGRECLNCGYRW